MQNQQTRLEDHLRLQGHKSHAAEDDDELQRIRIHFHIFLSCHISCQSGIYIHLDLISPLALSLSAVSCAAAGLYCSVPVKIFCLKQRARDGGPKFTPSECINVFVEKQGAAGLKLSVSHQKEERRRTDGVLHAYTNRAAELSCRVE